jgi:hypothetical protein
MTTLEVRPEFLSVGFRMLENFKKIILLHYSNTRRDRTYKKEEWEVKKKGANRWVWWYTGIISALGRLRQNDCKFKASLAYLGRPCLKKKRANIPFLSTVPPSPNIQIQTIEHAQVVLYSKRTVLNLI